MFPYEVFSKPGSYWLSALLYGIHLDCSYTVVEVCGLLAM